MNKKGFTLIELLAVIVILAIIALIATPIVLNIINDSKESAQLRSAEMYLKGVETSVATSTINNKKVLDGTYPITPDGDICLVALTNNKCEGDNNTLEVEMNGDKPESGSITIASGKITDIELIYSNGKTIVKNDGKLVYGEKEETEEVKTIDTICTHDSTNGVAEKTAGAKYSCAVKEGTSYTFYVLKTPAEGDTTINLIMDANINSSGEAVIPGVTEDTGLVAWNNESGQSTNAYGPVTAMTFLYNATKDWTNIEPVNYTYMDKETQGTIIENISYTSFVSTNGVAVITALDGTTTTTIGTSDEPLRARMPISASDTTITEVTSKTNAAYLYDNLDSSVPPYGYWTLSSYEGLGTTGVWYVGYNGFTFDVHGDGANVVTDSQNGVRPVITLKL